MNFWNRFPLVRAVLPFISGILIAMLFPHLPGIPLAVFFFLLIFTAFHAFYFYRKIPYSLRWIYGISIFLFFFLAGFHLLKIHSPQEIADHYSNSASRTRAMMVRLAEAPEIREKTVRVTAEAEAVYDSMAWRKCSGKILVYIRRDSLSENLNYGDLIFMKAQPEEVPKPLNPHEFDYKRYLFTKGVTHRVFAASGHWMFTGENKGFWLRNLAYQMRDKILNILESNGMQGSGFAVAAALLIGYKERLDADTLKEYSGTGAMHILCVSGMHVGIIFIVLNFLLSFTERIKGGSYFKASLILLFIWFYALLTGLSPSVLRASAMISFVVVGKTFRQPPDIYNTLAASALFLLLINPYYIADTGFQLSYLAVIGIVSIHPPLSKLWTPRFFLLKKIWSLVSVSVAAQLITFPLGILYFRQFPNYFLLTNLVALPLSTLVMYAGIAVIATSFMSQISSALGKVLGFLMEAMNTSIHIIDGLPGSVTRGITASFTEILLIYLILIATMIFLTMKKKIWLFISLSSACLLVLSLDIGKWQKINSKSLTIYSVPGAFTADFCSNGNCISVYDSATYLKKSLTEFHVQPNRDYSGAGIQRQVHEREEECFLSFIGKKNSFIQFRNQRMAVLHEAVFSNRKINLDLLITGGSNDMSLKEMQALFHAKLIIIDGTTPRYRLKKWQKESREHNIPVHILSADGAYVREVE